MGRGNFLKFMLVSFPALAIALVIFSQAILARLDQARSGTAWLALLARLTTGLGVMLFLLVVVAAGRGSYRGFARFSLAYTLALSLVMVGLTETFLPLPCPPTPAQTLLIEQLRRRHEEITKPYHGSLFVPGRANGLGWLDRDHTFNRKGRRILFIGDSMLEVRSRRRLALRVEDRLAAVEVVNLSMTGSDPLDYRFRLNEYAFDYQPEHIFVFLYGPNDFSLMPPYQPYRPRPVRVTRQTIESAQKVGLPATVVEALSRLARGDKIYTDRKSFLEAVGLALSPEQCQLLYTVAVAYSDAETRKFLQSTRSRLENLGTKLVEMVSKGLQKAGLPAPFYPDLQWWSTEPFLEREHKVYQLPPARRLRALAQLYAEFMHTPAGPVYDWLQAQSPQLRSWLTAEADMLWFLAIPLNRLSGLLDTPGPESVEEKRLHRERVALYDPLLTEMSDTARAHGCKLTFVFIPTPGLADKDFVRFWGDLLPTEWAARVYTEVLARAKNRVSCIDLGADPDRFRGGYWPLDGHWTDAANDSVADILVHFLQSQQPVSNNDAAWARPSNCSRD
ncbi:hypothetical protein IV102_02195 [bacterium]|nr:hypothetical protein [bacterium]